MLKGNKKSTNLLLHKRRHKNANDECYTPAAAVDALFLHVEEFRKRKGLDKVIVWCPFDTEQSEFVKRLSTCKGVEVVRSHIEDQKDFFAYEPQYFDVIISNPPFQNKKAFFERALSFKKPFALLMASTWLNDSAPARLFIDTDLLLFFDKRIHFLNDGKVVKNTTFSSSYFCFDFLAKQIIFQNL